MNGANRRKLTLLTIRNSIRLYRRYNRDFDPQQTRAMQIGMLNFFDYVFDQTTVEEMKAWFKVQEKVYEGNVDILLRWAGRKTTTKGKWPPGEYALKRMIRLYILSEIVGRTVESMNDLTGIEMWGIQKMYRPDNHTQVNFAGEFYLLCRALIHGGSELLLELATVPPL